MWKKSPTNRYFSSFGLVWNNGLVLKVSSWKRREPFRSSDPAPGLVSHPSPIHPPHCAHARQEVGLSNKNGSPHYSSRTKNGPNIKIECDHLVVVIGEAFRGSAATSPNDDEHGEERRNHPPECRGKEVRMFRE